jgi:hypothetical protein
MLPLGHPVPPETTFTILNAGGGVERFCGRAEATATTATTGRTNFILEYLISEKTIVSVSIHKQILSQNSHRRNHLSYILILPLPLPHNLPEPPQSPRSRLSLRLAQSTRKRSPSTQPAYNTQAGKLAARSTDWLNYPAKHLAPQYLSARSTCSHPIYPDALALVLRSCGDILFQTPRASG